MAVGIGLAARTPPPAPPRPRRSRLPESGAIRTWARRLWSRPRGLFLDRLGRDAGVDAGFGMVATREEDCCKQGGHRSAPPLSSSDAVVRFVPSASARHWSPAQRPPPGLTTSPSWSSPTRAGTRSASATVTPRRRHPAPDPSECSS